ECPALPRGCRDGGTRTGGGSPSPLTTADECEYARWIERELAHGHRERGEGVLDRVGDRRLRAADSGLAGAFRAEDREGARRDLVVDLQRREVGCPQHEVR